MSQYCCLSLLTRASYKKSCLEGAKDAVPRRRGNSLRKPGSDHHELQTYGKKYENSYKNIV